MKKSVKEWLQALSYCVLFASLVLILMYSEDGI